MLFQIMMNILSFDEYFKYPKRIQNLKRDRIYTSESDSVDVRFRPPTPPPPASGDPFLYINEIKKKTHSPVVVGS